MQIKSNCQLRIKKFVMSESYKLSPFLSSPRKRKNLASATNKLGNELNEAMHLSLDEINKRTVEGLRFFSKTEVGISVSKRAGYTRVYTDVKEVTTALRASRKCSAEVHRLEALGDAVAIQRSKGAEQSTKLQRRHTFVLLGCKSKRCMTRGEGSSSRWMLLVNLRCYTLSVTMVNKAKEGGEIKGGATTEATMNFEGRSVRVEGEGQIKQLLVAYTAYVPMDSTDESTGNQMDTHLKNAFHTFSRTEGIEDVFDERAKKEVDGRCKIIREEYARGETPIIEPQRDEEGYEETEEKVLEVYWVGWYKKLDDRQGRRHISQLLTGVL